MAAEKERLTKQLTQLTNQHTALQKKLSNDQFTSKAPEAVVNKVKSEFDALTSEIKTLEQQIATFS